jgi:hypothetical protein
MHSVFLVKSGVTAAEGYCHAYAARALAPYAARRTHDKPGKAYYQDRPTPTRSIASHELDAAATAAKRRRLPPDPMQGDHQHLPLELLLEVVARSGASSTGSAARRGAPPACSSSPCTPTAHRPRRSSRRRRAVLLLAVAARWPPRRKGTWACSSQSQKMR